MFNRKDPPGTVRSIALEESGVRMEFDEPMNFWAALALVQAKAAALEFPTSQCRKARRST